LGFRVGGLAYSCDLSDLPDDSVAALGGLEVWIVDALRYRPHPSHLNVEQSLGWIDRLGPRRAILTHMHTDLDYQRLKSELPSHVEPGFDGMQIELTDPDG
jgi:phosphoribosyl 1,2-cyclic phosphate phosphodiesterase